MVSKGHRHRKLKTKKRRNLPRGRVIREQGLQLAYGIHPTPESLPEGQRPRATHEKTVAQPHVTTTPPTYRPFTPVPVRKEEPEGVDLTGYKVEKSENYL